MIFSSLPNRARLWLYPMAHSLTAEESAALLDLTSEFLAEWRSHGKPVTAEAKMLEDCVLAVGAVISDEEVNAGVSGCGIDSLTRFVESAAMKLSLRQAQALDIPFFDQDNVLRVASRAEFRRIAESGDIDSETSVLDLTCATAGDLRSRGIRVRLAESWHKGFHPSQQPAKTIHSHVPDSPSFREGIKDRRALPS